MGGYAAPLHPGPPTRSLASDHCCHTPVINPGKSNGSSGSPPPTSALIAARSPGAAAVGRTTIIREGAEGVARELC